MKKTKGLNASAYHYILDLIMSRQLLPGDGISELKISQDLGVSRTPVRHAMHQLSERGLLEIAPNKIARVRSYSESEIRDVGILRIALDSTAIRLSTMYGSYAEFLHLSELAEHCIEIAKQGDLALQFQADIDFHMELAKISKNNLLMKFQKDINTRVQFIMLHNPRPPQADAWKLNQHLEIAKALMNHDEKEAQIIMTDHLTNFYNLKDQYPDEFFQT